MSNTYKFGNGTWARKKGSTLAYSDTNNAFKPLPFSFERNSIATRVNKEGLIEVVGNDIPRIDYTDSTEGALLLENSSTNLLTYSEDFSQSSWLKANNAIVSDTKVISPNGTLNASQIIFDGTSNGRIEDPISGLTQGADYTVSVYVRVASGTQEVFFGSFEEAPFTVTTKWQRLTRTQAENDTVAYPRLKCNDAVTIEIYGFQLEQNSVASSYIPTNGSTVQRSAETCNGSGNSEVFNDSQGVLFANIAALSNDGTYRSISLSNGTVNNSTNIQYSGVSNQIRTRIENGGSPQADITSTVTSQTLFHKIAVLYKSNKFELWSNGFKVGEDTNGTPPSGINKLSFDRGDGGNDFYGKTKEIAYYDEILTDEELEYMTSYRSLNEMVTELNLNAL